MTKAERLKMVKQAIREPYAWPGGYPLYIVVDDGEALSLKTAKENWSTIVYAVLANDRTGWFPEAVEVNWEDPALYCSHSNARIESAYAEDDAFENQQPKQN